MADEQHYNSIPIPKRVEDRPTEDDLTRATLGGPKGARELPANPMTKQEEEQILPTMSRDTSHNEPGHDRRNQTKNRHQASRKVQGRAQEVWGRQNAKACRSRAAEQDALLRRQMRAVAKKISAMKASRSCRFVTIQMTNGGSLRRGRAGTRKMSKASRLNRRRTTGSPRNCKRGSTGETRSIFSASGAWRHETHWRPDTKRTARGKSGMGANRFR